MDGWLSWSRFISWTALVAVAALIVHDEACRPELPRGVRAFTEIIYGRRAGRPSKLDIYVPTDKPRSRTGRTPAIVAIHGGGWRGGTKNGYGREMARLVGAGFVVVSVDYTLSRPGHPTWPDNLDDVREAVRWVRRNASPYGIDPDRIAAMGSSAGGHLAALLGTNALSDDPETRVAAVVNIYGPTDLTALYRSPAAVLPLTLYLGATLAEAPALYADASPIAHVDGSAAPMLMIHGETDPLVPVAQSSGLADRLRAVGVESRVIVVPRVGHAFGLKVDGRDLVPEIARFLDDALAKTARF